ncbi:MAG: large extracellular alpha-helical protein [gamma proteobacterium symbiont of Bathyaustriella thionipta]|nr:large extracellular alpha-helical protein [gamma proteobacterium symbiont of Bathyaustriella thionipta]
MPNFLNLFALLLMFLSSPLWAAFDSAQLPQQGELSLVRIMPSGEDVPAGRQLVFEFNRAVVPVGEMARDSKDIPIRIQPALNCQWRWLDRRNLACQLDEADALRAATRYQIRVAPDIRAEDGATLAKTVQHQFVTRRPDLSNSWFKTWRGPGSPVIRLLFNQPVKRDSVQQHLFFANAQQRLPVKIVPAEQFGDEKQLVKAEADGVSKTWFVMPTRPLPLDRHIKLRVEPGLQSSQGDEAGVADKVVLEFQTFAEFRFLGIRCHDAKTTERVVISANEPLAEQPKCAPLQAVSLLFNTPVSHVRVKQALQLTPDLAANRKDYDPWQKRGEYYSQLTYPREVERNYSVTLPELLKAAQSYELLLRAAQLRDEFGRSLPASARMSFATAHRRPKIQLPHQQAVLESGVDSAVPVYVTNLDSITMDYRRLTRQGTEAGLQHEIKLPQATDVAFPVKLGVRDMLAANSGVLTGTIRTKPDASNDLLGSWRPLFFEVTPFQVQLKLGHFSSLAWVLDMATGQPVADAEVSLYPDRYSRLQGQPQQTVHTDSQGLAVLLGLESLDPEQTYLYPQKNDGPRLFLRVNKDKDMALLPVDSSFQVWPNRIWPDARKRFGHMLSWGTTAQGVYRAGDRVQYKLFVRDQNNQSLTAADALTYQLEIIDPTGKTLFRKDIQLSEFGTYSDEFHVPETAAVGWYSFSLSLPSANWSSTPMQVLVSDFTPAPFRVTVDLNGKQFHQGDELRISSAARLHSGGPWSGAQTRVHVSLQESTFSSDKPIAEGFRFGRLDQPLKQITLLNEQKPLDKQGDLNSQIILDDNDIAYGRLRVETAVQDDRGKNVAKQVSAYYLGRDRFVGLKDSSWLHPAGQDALINVLVLDADGEVAGDTAAQVTVAYEKTTSARVKGAGNAFLTRYETSWEDVASCHQAAQKQVSECHFTPQKAGRYRISAQLKDSRGRVFESQMYTWVSGSEYTQWQQNNDNSLPIVAEKNSWKVGDTARYLIRNPFPGAQALITIERYGILRSWVQTFKTSTPVIEFPVTVDDAPGFYLSVTVFSPRVDKPLSPTGLDLGKPAWRMGYVEVPVVSQAKQLQVQVKTDKELYKPRESVQAQVQVNRPANSKPQALDLTVIVLDEAVFDLIQQGRDYFDPYKGFYALDSLDVLNYSLLSRLLGKQKIELKGANPGGDGGGLSLRSVFDYVAYWNPSLHTDKQGKARFKFKLPDNLTGWRVLVLAASKQDLMGLGEHHFKVNKATEIRPLLPNQVISGDRFQAGFSVMNRTEKARKLTVKMKASGPLKGVAESIRQLDLHAWERKSVWLPLQTSGPGKIKFQVLAGDKQDSDGLRSELDVLPWQALQSAASWGSSTKDSISESIAWPQDIRTDTGGLSVLLSPSVIGNLDGAFRYIRDYPFQCWEQRLDKAVMADRYQDMLGYLDSSLKWPQSRQLPQQFLDSASGFQAANGGMTFWGGGNDKVNPYLSAFTALSFNWLRDEYDIPQAVEAPLQDYLQQLLREDVLPGFYSKGMASTVRAVALAALAPQGRIKAQDISRYRRHVPAMSLFGKAQYLSAASSLHSDKKLLQEVVDQIMAHSHQSAGKLQFNEKLDDGYAWLLATPLRANCAILDAFSQLGESPAGAKMLGNAPMLLARTITQARGDRDHWQNTQENLFCMSALERYSQAYEKQKPDMQVQVKLDGRSLGETGFNDLRNTAVTLKHPVNADDVGRKMQLSLQKQGVGRLYYSTRMQYALKAKNSQRINAGMQVRREYSVKRNGKWQLLASPMHIQRAELVRVDLYLSLAGSHHFVALKDPLPGGLEAVNRDLATASTLDAEEGDFVAAGGAWWFKYSDWKSYGKGAWSFYHRELRHDAALFFADYLPAGNYHLSYTAQAIAAGDFAILPLHAEEMYDPDVYGTGLPMQLNVQDKKD